MTRSSHPFSSHRFCWESDSDRPAGGPCAGGTCVPSLPEQVELSPPSGRVTAWGFKRREGAPLEVVPTLDEIENGVAKEASESMAKLSPAPPTPARQSPVCAICVPKQETCDPTNENGPVMLPA